MKEKRNDESVLVWGSLIERSKSVVKRERERKRKRKMEGY